MEVTMNKLLIIIWLLPLSLLAQPRTIVGDWAPTKATCKSDDGVIRISPLAINAHDFSCSFKNVKRIGDSVVWEGTCEDQMGNMKPYAETVVAEEVRGKLTITLAKNRLKLDIATLIRCN
jgi:hypothetical protein